MRIATRLTLTTTLLFAAVLGFVGFVSLRDREKKLSDDLMTEARDLSAALRATIELVGFEQARERVSDLAQGFERVGNPWRIKLLDARDVPPPSSPSAAADGELARLWRVVVAKRPFAEETREAGRKTFVYLEPVRAPAADTPEGFRVVGAVQLSRDMGYLHDRLRDERAWVVISVVSLTGFLFAVILFLAKRSIGRPIAKLIDGIDGVAKGDFSQALLQEQDDEIGALATRFNDMTASLREAREETRRGVEAKLALEAQLRRSEKLATIGQLAAEIAHEVGTPLSVVAGRARALAKKCDDPEAVQKNGLIIAEQAQRITKIIQRLLDFSRRRGGEEKAPVDVNRLLQDTLEFLEHQLSQARVAMRLSVDPALGPIPGVRDHLQQVLLNLIMNAIQAMPQGGELHVATRRVLRRRPGLAVAPEQAYVVIEVADTGVGIPPAERDKIFEPFYTSRSDAGGSGLGLAVSHGIVRDHDGWIEIDDHVAAGRGTVFRVYLPATDAEATNEGGEAAACGA